MKNETQEEYWKRRESEVLKKRENRLKKIQAHLTDALKEVSPKDADSYQIKYYAPKEWDVTNSSPVFNFYLVSNLNKRQKYEIMGLYKMDIDKSVKNANIKSEYQIPMFEQNIEKGIKYLEKKVGKHQAKRGKSGIEKIVGIIGICVGLFFLSSNVTGNVIGNMTNSTSNWIGGVLFVLGLVGALVYFKNK